MKQRNIFLIVLILLISFFHNNLKAQPDSIDYLGQTPPGYYPEKFAPGTFATNEWGPVFSPDGTELFYTWQNPNGSQDYQIKYRTKEDGVWSDPVTAPFTDKDGKPELEPNFSPDGKRLYFDSEHAGGFGGADIWYVEKTDTGWSEAINAGSEINTEANENFAVFAADSSLYFCSDRDKSDWDIDIYYARFHNGTYDAPVKLSDTINTSGWDACPTEVKDKLIFQSTRTGGFGKGDICFAPIQDGAFGEPEILSPCFNTDKSEMGIVLSPDKKYLFFKHQGEDDVYWVDVETFDYLGAKEAPFNYVTSWYAGIPAQMEVAIHPEYVKRRVISEKSVDALSYNSLISMVNSCYGCIDSVKGGRKDITIYNESGNMASAKVESNEFFDHLHLAKYKNYWKIVNVVWTYYDDPEGDSTQLVTTLENYIHYWKTGDSAQMKGLIHPKYAGRKALSHTEVNSIDKMQLLAHIAQGISGELNYEILDLDRNIASVKLNSNDSTEFLHLTFQKNQWYVINSLRDFYIEPMKLAKINTQEENEQITVFPNPSKDELRINFNGIDTPEKIAVFDLEGRLQMEMCVAARGEACVNISNLASGVYFVRVDHREGASYKKVVVK